MSFVRHPPTGFVAPGFEQVLVVLSDSFARDIDKGCSFAAYYRGQPVVNIWGGVADRACRRPWKEDTMGFFYSTTKFVACVTIAHMIERGLLKYDDTIATYWPEFAQNGKENITLEMLLSYRAGLAVLSDNFDVRWMIDNPRLLHDMLARQKPFWTPGIDFFIGLPKPLQYRASRLEIIKLTSEFQQQQMNTFKGNSTLLKLSMIQPKDWNAARKLNDPDFMEIPLPSSHGVGTALAVAKFCGILANGGKHEGKTLLSPESIAKLQEPLSCGLDLTTSGYDIIGRGTWLIPVVEGKKSWFMFGHAGLGDQCCAADPQYQVGWAYTTNFLDSTVVITGKNKWRPLIAALFECVHKLENVQVERTLLNTFEDVEQVRLCQKQSSHL
ncbi:hypothetical protein BsWGS_06300 [Bradybaena similaris]